jgi:MFS family permease
VTFQAGPRFSRVSLSQLEWCLCIGHFLAFADRYIASAALSSIQVDLALSDGAAGVLLGPAFALAYVIGGLGFVVFGSRIGHRAILSGLLVWTAGECACASATGPLTFCVAQVAIGVGQALFIPSALQIMAQAGTQIGGRISLFTASSTLGRSVAVLAGGLLLSLYHLIGVGESLAWRNLYIMAAVANATLAVFIAAAPLSGSYRSERSPLGMGGWLAGMGKPALGIIIVTLPVIVLIQAAAVWMPTLCARQFSLDTARAARWIGLTTLLTAPAGQLLGGRLFDRWDWPGLQPHRAIAACAGGAAIAIVGVTVARSPTAMLGLLGAANLLLGIASLTGLAALQRHVPAARRASVNSLFLVLVTAVGAGLGPLLVGVLSDAHGAAAGSLAYALRSIAVATTLVIILAVIVQERPGRWRHRARTSTGQ